MFKLSPRMQLIYDQLLPGKPVWDLCCDHGYMGLNAYESGDFPAVYFVDQVGPIVQQLKERFKEKHLDPKSTIQTFFLSESAENLQIHLEGNVVIAGVGSFTIIKILRVLFTKGFLKAERLILCPQDGPEKLLHGLFDLSDFDYEICNEDCKVEERGRIRKLLILKRK